jgi:tripartite-type tricarboxylate transporter receptor subunit TctC
MKKIIRSIAGACFACWAATAALAADYPNHSLRLVVPFPAAGAQDLVARIVSRVMSEQLGQAIVVDNRAGAGGIIGAETVAKSAPDGYTILATIAGIHVINPALNDQLPYDPLTSWSPISLMVAAPLVLVVRNDSPFHSLKDLIDFARANPGKLSYGSAGVGTSLHLAGELFKQKAGVNILHVPYKGSAPALNDFLGGQTSMMFSYPASIMDYVKSGRVRMIAVGSPQRLPLIPDVPTIAESGVPGYDSDTWTGLVAPAGTPDAIVDKLNRAVNVALEQNRAQLNAQGYVILGGSPQAMRKRISDELKNLTPLIAQIMKVAGAAP